MVENITDKNIQTLSSDLEPTKKLDKKKSELWNGKNVTPEPPKKNFFQNFLNETTIALTGGVLNMARKAVNYNYKPDFTPQTTFIEENIGTEVVLMADWVAGIVSNNVEFNENGPSVKDNYINKWINDYITRDKGLIKTIAQSIIYNLICKLIKDVEEECNPDELNSVPAKRLAVLDKFMSIVLNDTGRKSLREIQSIKNPEKRDNELNNFFVRLSTRLLSYAFPKQFDDIDLPINLKNLLTKTMGWDRLQGIVENENGSPSLTGVAGILRNFYENDFKEFFEIDLTFVNARNELPKLLGKLMPLDNQMRNPGKLRAQESPFIQEPLAQLAKGIDEIIQKNFSVIREIFSNTQIKKILEALAPKDGITDSWSEEAQCFADFVGQGIDYYVENSGEHPLWNFIQSETEDGIGFFINQLVKSKPHFGPVGPHDKGDKDLFKKVATKALLKMEEHLHNLHIRLNEKRLHIFTKPEVLSPTAFECKSDDEFYPSLAKRVLAVFFPNGSKDLPIPDNKKAERWAQLEEAALSGMKNILEFFTDPLKRNELFIVLIRARRESALRAQGETPPSEYPPIPKTLEESKKALVDEALAWRNAEFSNRAVWGAIQGWLDDLIVKNFGILWPVKQKLDKVSRFVFFTVIRTMIKVVIFPILYMLEVGWKWRNRQWISSVVDMITLPENKKIVQEMTEIFIEMLEEDYPNKEMNSKDLDANFSAACKKVVGSTLRIHPHRELQPLLMLFLGKGSEITEGTLEEIVDTKGMSPIEVLVQFGARILNDKPVD